MGRMLFLILLFGLNEINAQEVENLYSKLIGKWEVNQVLIRKENAKMSATEKEAYNQAVKKMKKLQSDIDAKNSRLILELNKNGTYKFVVFQKSKAIFEEEGSFYVNENVLNASNDNGFESSYENHIIIQIDKNSFTAKHFLKSLNNKASEIFKHIRLNY